jgi:circadian clock protein KaiB
VSKAKTFTRSLAASAPLPDRYELYLFIAGTTPLSAAALANIVDICEERLTGQCDLVVVDIYQEPARAMAAQIVAVPTLLKKSPLPVRRLIGDLSDRTQVLSGLGLPAAARQTHESHD